MQDFAGMAKEPLGKVLVPLRDTKNEIGVEDSLPITMLQIELLAVVVKGLP